MVGLNLLQKRENIVSNTAKIQQLFIWVMLVIKMQWGHIIATFIYMVMLVQIAD